MTTMWANFKNKGFTIVELLIVIVVIGILASITIVAYNGVQTRAENTKTINSVAAYAKTVFLYVADQNAYPISSYSCLGPSGTKCANVTDSTAACNGAGTANYNATFANALAPYTSSLPPPSTQNMNCGGKQYGGAWYHSTDGKSAILHIYLRGNTTCPNTLGGWTLTSRFQQDDTTICMGSFPTLS